MKLNNGSRVVIVGGGPAGSLCALHLLRYAAKKSLGIEVLVYEPRNFSLPGAGSCNKCAGILSSNLVRNLESLGLVLPPAVIQSELTAYILHLDGREVPIQRPDTDRRIFSVYRGRGPRLGKTPHPESFDGWLLAMAETQGAVVRRERVRSVLRGERPTVVTAREAFEADLVIIATGVNTRTPLEPAWSYQPPQTEVMAQDEIPMPEGYQDNTVHIFFAPPRGLIFGGLIPKGQYANISLLGHHLPLDAITEFLEGHNLTGLMPEGTQLLCGCAPRVAVSLAKGYYANRMVVVGDAAVTRLYKDGIGAAFTTAEAAARTAIEQGVSQEDFAAGFRPVCRRLALDNIYGRMIFTLWNILRNSPTLMNAWQQAVLRESRKQVHRRALWGMFTGDELYRHIFWASLSRTGLGEMWRGAMASWRKK